jgi:hypothetical protein
MSSRWIRSVRDGVFAGALYALLAWLLLDSRLESHTVPILAVAIGFFALSAIGRSRERRSGSTDHPSSPESSER